MSVETTRLAATPDLLKNRGLIAFVVGAAATVLFTAVSYGPQMWDFVQRTPVRLHAPNLALIAAAPLPVQAHLYAVLAALAVGVYLMVGPKGRIAHRILGWTWAAFMLTAAGSSLFIRHGGFSLLHLFSVFVLISVPLSVAAARRHNVISHSRGMSGVFWGGLIFAGTLAFLPGRLMWHVFFG